MGQIFVALCDEDAPRLSDSRDFINFVLAATNLLSVDIACQELPWRGIENRVRPAHELRTAITQQLDSLGAVESGDDLRIAVVAPRILQKVGRATDLREVLTSWAMFTALRFAGEAIVYEFADVPCYAYLVPGGEENETGSVACNAFKKSIEVFRPDGTQAGWLSTWVVKWGHRELLMASESLGNELVNLILAQVPVAASSATDLNEMRSDLSRGDYARAFAAASRVVTTHGSVCGLAVNDLTRLTMLRGDFSRAAADSTARMEVAAWDIAAHANYLLALLGEGRLDSAAREIRNCPICSPPKDLLRAGESSSATLALARALIAGIYGKSRRDLWEAGREVDMALAVLLPTDVSRRKQLWSCIHDIAASVRNTIEPIQRVRLSDTLTGLGLAVDDGARDSNGQAPHWNQVFLLKLILAVLQGIVMRGRTDLADAGAPVDGRS